MGNAPAAAGKNGNAAIKTAQGFANAHSLMPNNQNGGKSEKNSDPYAVSTDTEMNNVMKSSKQEFKEVKKANESNSLLRRQATIIDRSKPDLATRVYRLEEAVT